MIAHKTHKQAVLDLLSDGKPHFSAEFRDTLGLLEYRKRVSELRAEGYLIRSFKLKDGLFGAVRPAYQLLASNSPAIASEA